jgi:FdhE protein
MFGNKHTKPCKGASFRAPARSWPRRPIHPSRYDRFVLSDPNDPLIQPGVIPLHAPGPDPIVPPDPTTVFADRARRFDALASRDPQQRAFFRFMAALARAQASAVDAHRPPPSADEALALAHRHGMPVLPAGLSDRPAAWIGALRAVRAAIASDAALVPARAEAAGRQLDLLSDAEIDRLAGQLLAYDYESLPPDVVPWLAAGLQVHWSVAAQGLGAGVIRKLDTATVCPCCGSLPVASLVRIGGLRQGVRYLVCSLCSTEWHFVRVKCSHCESTKGIGYLSLSVDPDGESGREAATRDVVKAEVCDECSSYLKVVSLEHDTGADPVADDLATLALDVLTDARGYGRIGPNLFVHPGIVAA